MAIHEYKQCKAYDIKYAKLYPNAPSSINKLYKKTMFIDQIRFIVNATHILPVDSKIAPNWDCKDINIPAIINTINVK